MLYLTGPSQLASKALSTQIETENTRPASNTNIIQAVGQTSQLPLLPPELFDMIIRFFSTKKALLTLSLVCTLFRDLCRNNALYEEYFFFRNNIPHPGSQFHPKTQNVRKRRRFHSEVDFSTRTMKQPKNIRVHVFTTSDSEKAENIQAHVSKTSDSKKTKNIQIHAFKTSESEKIPSSKVVSMAVELSTSDERSGDTQTKALDFLDKLFKRHPFFKKLKHLRLSGFWMTSSLWALLSKLRIDWLHLTCSVRRYFIYDTRHFLGFKRLDLKLKEQLNLRELPYLPPPLDKFLYFPVPLEEFSLHISKLKKNEFLNIGFCETLKTM